MRLATSSQSETIQHFDVPEQNREERLPDASMLGVGEVALSASAREALILEHMATVRFMARRIHDRLPHHMELDDLISAGLLGLIDAASKFDWTKQVQFKSYAQFRIRGAMLDSLRLLDWSPRELRRKGRSIAEATRQLSANLGRTPADSEIAAEMNMDLFSFQQLVGEIRRLQVSSLNAERTDESGDEELDFLPAPEVENPLSVYLEGEAREQLGAALASLPEKERLVLTLYYLEELTMKEIGLTLGVVESRVSQIRASALARLRTVLEQPAGPSASKTARSNWN